MRYKFPYKRLPNWNVAFTRFLRDAQKRDDLVLDWTTNHCIGWCCEGIAVITGHNPYDEFREEVQGIISAAGAITNRGFASLDQIIGSYLYSVPVGKAQRGDLVLVEADWETTPELQAIFPHGVGLADPPFYWVVTPQGLGKGELYKHGLEAFAVGRKA